jgi:hypothetical protein
MNWVFISQKTTFFIVTAVKTSNLTNSHLKHKRHATKDQEKANEQFDGCLPVLPLQVWEDGADKCGAVPGSIVRLWANRACGLQSGPLCCGKPKQTQTSPGIIKPWPPYYTHWRLNIYLFFGE